MDTSFELEKPLPKYAFRAETAHILLKGFVSVWCAKLAEIQFWNLEMIAREEGKK